MPLLFLYRCLFYLSLPIILLRLFYRSIRIPAYAQRWAERFAFFTPPKRQTGLWVHAVSLGETVAVTPLIKRFMQQYPTELITITTTTPTGSEQVKKTFSDNVFHVYAPYDLPDVVNRFLNRIKPRVAVMVETELWPNIILACGSRQIPVLVVNGRLSQRSALRYARFASLTKMMLAHVNAIAVQTQLEAERYIALGLSAERLQITGSIKFDISVPASAVEQAVPLKQQWGSNRLVWTVASTHEGEEEIILNTFRALKQRTPELLLILVPRHPDRFTKVASLCDKFGFNVVRRSLGDRCTPETDILLGDTVGEMMIFYAAADLAFVGGSFAEIGGHNVLEPAALGLPILTGPHVFNFLQINQLLAKAGALVTVASASTLLEQLERILQDPALRAQMGEAALQVVEENRGALDKQYELLQYHFASDSD